MAVACVRNIQSVRELLAVAEKPFCSRTHSVKIKHEGCSARRFIILLVLFIYFFEQALCGLPDVCAEPLVSTFHVLARQPR